MVYRPATPAYAIKRPFHSCISHCAIFCWPITLVGLAAFADSIIDLANSGCNIIVDDLSYLTNAMFQDDVVAQAVDYGKFPYIPASSLQRQVEYIGGRSLLV